jgi:hypothetical protein
MSIHGCCFDEGNAGHCGLQCRCFQNNECDIRDEVIDNSINYINDLDTDEIGYLIDLCYRDDEVRELVLIHIYGELKLNVMLSQTINPVTEFDLIDRLDK